MLHTDSTIFCTLLVAFLLLILATLWYTSEHSHAVLDLESIAWDYILVHLIHGSGKPLSNAHFYIYVVHFYYVLGTFLLHLAHGSGKASPTKPEKNENQSRRLRIQRSGG